MAPSDLAAADVAGLSLLQRVPLYPAETAAARSTVCVTGATSYISGPIIERLLRAGHTVHATCRDPSNWTALNPLIELPGATERLRFFKADLMLPGSFDAAVHGCEYVIHVAAPVLLNRLKPGEGRTQVVEPMLRGVENVLGAVQRCPSVRRVVMTSSITTLCSFALDSHCSRARRSSQPPTFGPDDWNNSASETVLPYMYGKTVSERRAWELYRQQSRWELITVLPSIVFGPAVGACSGSESVQAVRDILWSGLAFPAVADMGLSVVDVRDVAAVHCLAMVTPSACGRYIAHAHDTNTYDCTHAIAARFPNFWPARFLLPYWLTWLVAPLLGLSRDVVRASWGAPPRYETRRTVEELGLARWVALEDMFEDMSRDLAAKGLIRLS